jgi:E3 ubiquitin-protein ligase DOA10
MSECRICYSDKSDHLISPCKCRGSVMHVHQECLLQWLRIRSPISYQSAISKFKLNKTGLYCELCKYEYKGKISYINKLQILKKLKNSNLTYSILINIPIIIYLIYKFKTLMRNIFWLVSDEILIKKSGLYKPSILKFYTKLLMKLFPITVYGTALPLIGLSTLKISLKLDMQFKTIKFENYKY